MQSDQQKLLIPIDLNTGQREAYKSISEFLEDGGYDMFLLEGYAGTGKTYLVSKIIRRIFDRYPHWRIAVTAPTNKAVKVLQRSSSLRSPRLSFQTIHKLLGLREEITNDGKQIFTRKNEDDSTIEEFHVVIIDEVSMLNDELFVEIQKYAGHIKIIFMGDPAQIPPVGKPDCIPFIPAEREKYLIRQIRLNEIMRQNLDNPIVDASFKIRNDLQSWVHDIEKTTQLNEEGKGIVYINAGSKEERDQLTEYFKQYFDCPEFAGNPDYAKIIAWRNITVANLNRIIRSLIYKTTELSKIMDGEKLIANKPVVSDYDTIIFNTNDEFEVVSYDIRQRSCATDSETLRLSYYEAQVQYTDEAGNIKKRTIEILHEESEADFNKVVKYLKDTAIKTKGANRAWVKYYNFLRMFADVNYNYAITAHKAQGSTYGNVFIIEDDIDYNSNVYERNRIKYTAYTRPTHKLFIVKR